MVVYSPAQNAFLNLIAIFIHYFIEYWFVSIPLAVIFTLYLLSDSKNTKQLKVNIKVIKRR